MENTVRNIGADANANANNNANNNANANDNYMQQLVNNMISALYDEPELLNWFMNYSPPLDQGYMFVDHPNINILSKLVEKDAHSGASFSYCCRATKEYIRMDQLHEFPIR